MAKTWSEFGVDKLNEIAAGDAILGET